MRAHIHKRHQHASPLRQTQTNRITNTHTHTSTHTNANTHARARRRTWRYCAPAKYCAISRDTHTSVILSSSRFAASGNCWLPRECTCERASTPRVCARQRSHPEQERLCLGVPVPAALPLHHVRHERPGATAEPDERDLPVQLPHKHASVSDAARHAAHKRERHTAAVRLR